MAEEVGLSPFGGSSREQALASFDEDAEVNLWLELRDALVLGAKRVELDYPGAPKAPQFCAPAMADQVFKSIEAGMLVITAKDVHVHAEPKSSSPVIDTLSHDIVKMGPLGSRRYSPEEIGGETYPWLRIVTPSAEIGYAYGKHVREWQDYEACFRKLKGKWLLISLDVADL